MASKQQSANAKHAQVWIETVLYTLIGLAVIGLLLAVTRPRISATQDEFIVQQTMQALSELDSKINEVKQAVGNVRIVDFQLQRGELEISAGAENSIIEWRLFGTSYMLSEPGQSVDIGKISALTEQQGNKYNIKLLLNYTDTIELNVDGKNSGSKTLYPAKVPYAISIENSGPSGSSGKLLINISIK